MRVICSSRSWLAIAIFLFFLGIICNPAASLSETIALSLDAAVDNALLSNPEILAAKKNYEAAEARISQEFAPEDPMVEYNL